MQLLRRPLILSALKVLHSILDLNVFTRVLIGWMVEDTRLLGDATTATDRKPNGPEGETIHRPSI